MSSSQTVPINQRRNINLEASARGGRAARTTHRVAQNFAGYLGTKSSFPVAMTSLNAVLLMMSSAEDFGKYYAVVSKASSRRKGCNCGNRYATTLLEYDPSPNGKCPIVYRAVHSESQRQTFLRLEAQSNGHVVALFGNEPFVTATR